MTRTRILAFALVALSLSLVAAGTAQASEGPFWAICKNVGPGNGNFKDPNCKEASLGGGWERTRLAKGETAELEAKAKTEFILSNGTQTLICQKLKLEKATAIGSSGLNAGTSEETVVFEECIVEGNGAACKIVGGKIKTEPVKNTLDFPKKEVKPKDIHLVLFQPVKGAVFVKIKFEGTCTIAPEAAVEGSVAAQLDNGKKEPLELEVNEELAEENLITFPTTLITVDWIEEEGVRKEVKVGLKSFGKAAKTFTGKAGIKMKKEGVQVADWGVFSH